VAKWWACLITLNGDWSDTSAEVEYYASRSDDEQDLQAYLDGLKKGFTEPMQTSIGNSNTQIGGALPVLELGKLLNKANFGVLSHTPIEPEVVLVVDPQAVGVLDAYVMMMEDAVV